MSKIRVLPEHLANRIAAGEVVERPASVVKELLENSIDAGADRIEIEVEGGGTRLIRIIDNGEGMDEDDILLCLERHGTSKIAGDQDLDAITTLGFRGEAIPSIGSVARLVIESRPEDNELGTRLVADFGRLLKIHETGCHRGTTIEVRNLFGNTPARRKFLRTARTELGHIDEVVKNAALAAPQVSFIVRIDGRQTLRLDGGDPLHRRLAAIMQYSGPFIEVGRPAGQRSAWGYVNGLLVPPEAPIAAVAVLRLFVNGRAVRDRLMAHAVAEGARGFLMKGRNPAGALHLHLPLDEVDVNVHPAKHEVRFRNSHAIHEMIRQTVELALQDLQGAIKTDIFQTPPKGEPAAQAAMQPGPFSGIPVRPPDDPVRRPPQPLFPPPVAQTPAPEDQAVAPAGYRVSYFDHPAQTAEPLPAPTQTMPPEPEPAKKTHQDHGLQVIGQFDNLYIFCKSADGLVVIDQHAAHERLLFERLRQQFLHGRVASQRLLFPVTVELSVLQSRLVEKNIDEIERIGFAVTEFGGNTHIITAVPALGGQTDPGVLFMDILQRFGSDSGTNRGAGRLEDILADMACKAAVRSGDKLSPPEIDALLTQMARADLFSHCPHGRPVIKHLKTDEIKKWFNRP